jgi:type I thyroxine 5'-deiodinase
VGHLEELRREFADDVDFVMVYIREAHAAEEWVTPDNTEDAVMVFQPRTHDDRVAAANGMCGDVDIGMTIVVDDVDDRVNRAYGAWPDRMYVVDSAGRVAYQGGVGPWGFRPDEIRTFLNAHLGRGDASSP